MNINWNDSYQLLIDIFIVKFIDCCRQIHPLYGEKAGLLGYCDSVGNTENFPPAPNIVVEGGRIEFMRPSQDGTTLQRRNTISRGSQTSIDYTEKSDPAKVRKLSIYFYNFLKL